MTTPKPAKSGQIFTYYVFYGEDEFTRKNELHVLQQRMGDTAEAQMNTARFDGAQTSVSQILAAARSMPFLSDKRLVVIEGMLTHLTRKGAGKDAKNDLESLIVALPTLPDWARVIFHEPGKLPESHPIFKLIGADSRGFEKEFKPLDRDRAIAWMVRRAAAENVDIESGAASRLFDLVGADLRALESEIIKLAMFTSGQRPISDEDVAIMVAGTPESTVFQLVDMMASQNGRAAIRTLHRLLEARQEPLALMGMINRQFRLLIQVKAHIEAGGDTGDLIKRLNMKDWQVRSLISQSNRFTLQRLEAIHHTLLDIDFRIKTGQVDGVLALDTLIAELSG